MIPCDVLRDGIRIGPVSGSLHLEENTSYELVVNSTGDVRAWLDRLPLGALSPGRFTLQCGFWVGNSVLRVESNAGEVQFPIRVSPSAHKLRQGEWQAILSDIEAWLSGCSVGMEGGLLGSVENGEGASPQFLAVALLPLVSSLVGSLLAICSIPRTQDVGYWADMELRNIRKAGREAVAWVSRHPDVGTWLDPWKRLELIGEEPRLPIRQVMETIDHPANRYVVWLARQAANALASTAVFLRMMAESNQGNDNNPWCHARADALDKAAATVKLVLRRSSLQCLQPQPLSEAALLVVHDDPIYSRFHNLGRLFVSPRFRLDNDACHLGAPVRPSFEIYEIWCFLALQDGLRQALPGWKWKSHGFEKILDLGSSGSGAWALGTAPNSSRILLEFNPVFPGYFSRNNVVRWSLSSERRPDIVISWRPASGTGWWACLDAKYRVGRNNLGDAFSSVHIYRDALVWSELGGAPRHTYLIAPRASEDCAEWFSSAFHDANFRGIMELRPPLSGRNEVVNWIIAEISGTV